MMIALRTATQNILTPLCQEVYYHKASKKATYPRCIYSIDAYEDEGLMRGTLSIDVYDDKNDTADLESLVQNIRIAFKNKLIVTDVVKCACYYDRTLVLDDDNKALNRRQLQFELRIYEE